MDLRRYEFEPLSEFVLTAILWNWPDAWEIAQAAGEAARPVEEYFLEAIATVRADRRNYCKRRPAQFMEARDYGFIVE
jgi:hypothetical protein